jgi:hypothetical protein
MDNQQSYNLRETARTLKLKMEFIAPEVKRPNRAERAIRTAKNHMIATRAGFHPDCSHAYLNKCLPQIVIILNLIHPFEYNDSISAYHGVHGKRFNFNHHPIVPLAWMQSINLGFTRQSRILVGPRHRSHIYRTCLGSLQSFQRLDSHQLGI